MRSMIGYSKCAKRNECIAFQSHVLKYPKELLSAWLHVRIRALRSIEGVGKEQQRCVLLRSARGNPYSVLQIPPNSDLKTVKEAYRRLIKTTHPDINKESTAAKRAIEIISAYSTLCEGEVETHANRFHAY